MAAMGVVNRPRELRMVLALGEALGAGEAFRGWLGPIAAAKGLDLADAQDVGIVCG